MCHRLKELHIKKNNREKSPPLVRGDFKSMHMCPFPIFFFKTQNLHWDAFAWNATKNIVGCTWKRKNPLIHFCITEGNNFCYPWDKSWRQSQENKLFWFILFSRSYLNYKLLAQRLLSRATQIQCVAWHLIKGLEEMFVSWLHFCFDLESITQCVCYGYCMPLPGLIIPFLYPGPFLTVTSSWHKVLPHGWGFTHPLKAQLSVVT